MMRKKKGDAGTLLFGKTFTATSLKFNENVLFEYKKYHSQIKKW